MNKILNSEAAWLAGLFEGEGSVGIYKGAFRLSIGQHARSRDVLDRVKEITGIGTVYGPYRKETTPVVFYQITSKKDVIKFIKLIYPWLLERRRNQCDKLLNKESNVI